MTTTPLTRLVVLAATGGTGRELVRQALERGHAVIALARDREQVPEADRLRRISADVWNPESIRQVVEADMIVLSGLGNTRGGQSGALTAGARAVISAAPNRIIWLGALGTGASAGSIGAAAKAVIGYALRREMGDKVTADAAVLDAGGTVFHAGPLSNAALSANGRTVLLDAVPPRLFPASVSRATVAAQMLDEAQSTLFPGLTVVPLMR